MEIDRRAALAVFAFTFGGCATTGVNLVDPTLATRPAGSPVATLLRVPRPFRRLPSITIPIEDKTVATRVVFVEADASSGVRRAVIVQFEAVNAGSDFRFRYPARPPETFGGHVYRFTAFAYDDERTAAAEPGKEAAQTRALLIRQGLKPPRYWQVARLARVVGAGGLHELIVFYLENADARYRSGPPPIDADGDIPLDDATRTRLLGELRRTVKIVYDPPAGA